MDITTEIRLMALGGWVVLYGAALGAVFGIKALSNRRERQ
jgi:hypothetical protein